MTIDVNGRIQRSLGRRIVSLFDNAMLFKDSTQWLRNKTFLTLFVALLGISEIVVLLMAGLDLDEEGINGPIGFGLLMGVLILFGLITAFSGYGLTAKEFQNRTFELYELAGMSLERMVFGKFMSLMVQFLFGFFCVLPFMFVTFVMGGLDFYTIFALAGTMAIVSVPLFLFAVLIALLSKRKVLANVGRGLGIIFAILFVLWIVPGLLFSGIVGSGGGLGSVGNVVKSLLAGNADAWTSFLVSAAFYAQFCLLLFYLCCNAISPTVDSRQTAVQVLFTTLCLSALGVMGWEFLVPGIVDLDEAWGLYSTLAGFLAFFGALFVFSRLDLPIMAGNRRKRARLGIARAAYWWFAPTAAGAARTIVLILAAGVALAALTRDSEIWKPVSAFVQIPFFLTFPFAILVNIRSVRQNLWRLGIILMVWWFLGGAILLILLSVVTYGPRNGSSEFSQFAIHMLSLLVSPLSSMISANIKEVDSQFLAPTIRFISGGIGLWFLFSLIHRRKTLHGRDRQKLAAAVHLKESPDARAEAPPEATA